VRRWIARSPRGHKKYTRIWPLFGDLPSVLLLQLGVFRFGLLKNNDVGVGILPQLEEVLERRSGFRRVARKREGAASWVPR
jgi:hypothetical protein